MVQFITFLALLIPIITAPKANAVRTEATTLYVDAYLAYRWADYAENTGPAFQKSEKNLWAAVQDVKTSPDWPSDFCLGSVNVGTFKPNPTFVKAYRSSKDCADQEKNLRPLGELIKFDVNGPNGKTVQEIKEFAMDQFATELNVTRNEIIGFALPFAKFIPEVRGGRGDYEIHVAIVMAKE